MTCARWSGVLLLVVWSCSSGGGAVAPPDAEAVPDTALAPSLDGTFAAEDAVGVRFIRNLDVDGVTTLDVVTGDREDAPVVVLLHGTRGERSNMEPLARRLAQGGALVYVASWPVIEDVPRPSVAGELYRLQVDAVACAVDHARRTASSYGGDPGRLTIVGYSGGGMVGAAAALVDPAPWDLTCAGGSAPDPDLFIGLAGDYAGSYQYGGSGGAAFSRYSPFDIAPTNRDLRVRLVHGTGDENLNVSVSAALSDHLVAAGLDAALVTTDGDHADMIVPTSSEGDDVASLIERWIRGDDVVEPSTAIAAMTFDGTRCTYDGPTRISSGDTIAVQLMNSTDRVVTLSLVSVRPGAASPELTSDVAGGSLSQPPAWVQTGAFRDVPGGSLGSMTWRITDADHRWVAYCLDPTRDGGGTMHAATRPDGSLALLSPADAG